MGARGKQSSMIRRQPATDVRPHSSLRGIMEGSPAYWNLVNGEPAHWADPSDPLRAAAWALWRDRIMERWKRPGWRPAGWVAFDLPPLLARVRPWRRDMLEIWNAAADVDRQIPLAELVFGLRDTSDAERAEITEGWEKSIALADGDLLILASLDVPPWFVTLGKAA